MEKLKNFILKLKSFFNYFLIGYIGLNGLYLILYLVYMIVCNAKYKKEYDFTVYNAGSFIITILSNIIYIGFFVAALILLKKDKQKEAKFLFVGWFIYSLFSRFFNSYSGINTMVNGDIVEGILILFIALSMLFAMISIMLEVFNGNDKLSFFAPLAFIVAFSFSTIYSIFELISTIVNAKDYFVFPFYQIPSLFTGPVIIILLALVAYIFITPVEEVDEIVIENNDSFEEQKDNE